MSGHGCVMTALQLDGTQTAPGSFALSAAARITAQQIATGKRDSAVTATRADIDLGTHTAPGI